MKDYICRGEGKGPSRTTQVSWHVQMGDTDYPFFHEVECYHQLKILLGRVGDEHFRQKE